MKLSDELQKLQDARLAKINELLAKAEDDDERFTISRMKGIGGSDMSAILGMSKWRSAYQIWREKTFRTTEEEKARNKDYLPFATGHALEKVVADRYEKQTGYTVYEANSISMTGYDFIVGNFDRIVYTKPIDDGGQLVCGLECKTCGQNNKIIVEHIERSKWGKPNLYDGTELTQESSEIDPEYYPQVQFYMMVSGLKFWDVGVLIGNTDLRFYRVHANAEYQQKMLQACVEFWTKNVLQDVPPVKTMDDVKNDVDDVQENVGEVTPEIMSQLKDIQAVKFQIDELESKKKALENKLAGDIAAYTKMTYHDENGKVKTAFTFKSSNRESFDLKAFQAQNPELYKQYLNTITTARCLKIFV